MKGQGFPSQLANQSRPDPLYNLYIITKRVSAAGFYPHERHISR